MNVPTQHYCERCGQPLDESKAVWLELNKHSGKFLEVETVPANQSQGCFPFGEDCANAVRKAGGKLTRIMRAKR
jgi:hypothetical protein